VAFIQKSDGFFMGFIGTSFYLRLKIGLILQMRSSGNREFKKIQRRQHKELTGQGLMQY